ncbi:hypothetical protein Tco_0723413 [Tanacetum coccineum]
MAIMWFDSPRPPDHSFHVSSIGIRAMATYSWFISSLILSSFLTRLRSRSTYQTTSSSPSESPTPTHVAPPPKLKNFIPMKLERQELPPQQTLPHNTRISTVDNWPPGPSNPSPPPRISRPPPRFEHPSPPQPLFVNVNNKVPQLENLPPNLGNQQFPNPPNNILDFIHSNDMPPLYNMFCQCCSTTRQEIHMLRERVNYMFSYIRYHLGSLCNPPFFPH